MGCGEGTGQRQAGWFLLIKYQIMSERALFTYYFFCSTKDTVAVIFFLNFLSPNNYLLPEHDFCPLENVLDDSVVNTTCPVEVSFEYEPATSKLTFVYPVLTTVVACWMWNDIKRWMKTVPTESAIWCLLDVLTACAYASAAVAVFVVVVFEFITSGSGYYRTDVSNFLNVFPEKSDLRNI